MKKILMIVPSRDRNENHMRFAEHFLKNSNISDLVFGLDDDNEKIYTRLNGVKYEILPRTSMNGTLNSIAKKYCNEYEYIGFSGDDVIFRTHNWDQTMYDKIKDTKFAVAYGDDLLQSQELPTAPIIDSRIIQVLGYMAPLQLKHQYIDKYWKALGNAMNTIFYFPEIITEHMHCSVNKADVDEIYKDVNSKNTVIRDRHYYKKNIIKIIRRDKNQLLSH